MIHEKNSMMKLSDLTKKEGGSPRYSQSPKFSERPSLRQSIQNPSFYLGLKQEYEEILQKEDNLRKDCMKYQEKLQICMEENETLKQICD
jgi:hypothetical protein